jgi:hypothetical protein
LGFKIVNVIVRGSNGILKIIPKRIPIIKEPPKPINLFSRRLVK